MIDVLGKIFGTDKVISRGMDMLDDLHYSDSEKAEDRNKAKIALLKAYEPFKLAQRYLALIFTFIFVFIMLNGVLGALYGMVDMTNVDKAKEFANDMWLGEIMLAIVSFYFGGGLINSIKDKK